MVNGKPTLTLGDGILPPARARANSKNLGMERGIREKNFASFLPGGGAQAQAATLSAPTVTPAQTIAPSQNTAPAQNAVAAPMQSTARRSMPRLNNVGEMRIAPTAVSPGLSSQRTLKPVAGADLFSAALETPLAGSFSSRDTRINLDAPIPSAPAQNQQRNGVRRAASMDKNLTEAQMPAEGEGLVRTGSIGMGKQAARRITTPITGRNLGFGMEDTRLQARNPALQEVARTQQYGGQGAAASLKPGMDMNDPRNAAMVSKVMEQEKNPLRALSSLPPGTRIGQTAEGYFANPTTLPASSEADAQYLTRQGGIKQNGGRKKTSELAMESQLLSGPSTQSMFQAFNDVQQARRRNAMASQNIAGLKGTEEIGVLAARYESGDDGIAAIGYDRTGGTSYGKFQIASRAGTMAGFLSYLRDNAPDLADRLSSAGAANTGSRSGRMPAIWKEIAQEQPERFENLQTDFIRTSHFQPAMSAIAENTGLAFEKMHPALQEVLFSTAVQHGPVGAARIISRAVSKVGTDSLQADAPEMDTFNRAGQALIKQIYAIRAGQFGSSTEQIQAAAQTRLTSEMREALAMFSQPVKKV